MTNTEKKLTIKWWNQLVSSSSHPDIWPQANRSIKGAILENSGVFEIEMCGPLNELTEQQRTECSILIAKLRLLGCEVENWP